MHKVEIMNKNESITAPQNSLTLSGLKQESVLLKHKKDIDEKDIEICVLLNNLNDMNKQNYKSVNDNKQQKTPKES